MFAELQATIEIAATETPHCRLKRRSRNPAMVKTCLRRQKGTNPKPRISRMRHASHPKWPTASPDEAPVPERPMKCSVEIFDTNKDAPMKNHPMSRPARK